MDIDNKTQGTVFDDWIKKLRNLGNEGVDKIKNVSIENFDKIKNIGNESADKINAVMSLRHPSRYSLHFRYFMG